MVYKGMCIYLLIENTTHCHSQPGYGTRLIPDGAITGAHFVQTPDYVQVTGISVLHDRVILVANLFFFIKALAT
jgi:hypothetical protein